MSYRINLTAGVVLFCSACGGAETLDPTTHSLVEAQVGEAADIWFEETGSAARITDIGNREGNKTVCGEAITLNGSAAFTAIVWGKKGLSKGVRFKDKETFLVTFGSRELDFPSSSLDEIIRRAAIRNKCELPF